MFDYVVGLVDPLLFTFFGSKYDRILLHMQNRLIKRQLTQPIRSEFADNNKLLRLHRTKFDRSLFSSKIAIAKNPNHCQHLPKSRTTCLRSGDPVKSKVQSVICTKRHCPFDLRHLAFASFDALFKRQSKRKTISSQRYQQH